MQSLLNPNGSQFCLFLGVYKEKNGESSITQVEKSEFLQQKT